LKPYYKIFITCNLKLLWPNYLIVELSFAHVFPVRSDVVVNFFSASCSFGHPFWSFLLKSHPPIYYISFLLPFFYVMNIWKFGLTTVSNPSTKALSSGWWWELWRGKENAKKRREERETLKPTQQKNVKKNYFRGWLKFRSRLQRMLTFSSFFS